MSTWVTYSLSRTVNILYLYKMLNMFNTGHEEFTVNIFMRVVLISSKVSLPEKPLTNKI